MKIELAEQRGEGRGMWSLFSCSYCIVREKKIKENSTNECPLYKL